MTQRRERLACHISNSYVVVTSSSGIPEAVGIFELRGVNGEYL